MINIINFEKITGTMIVSEVPKSGNLKGNTSGQSSDKHKNESGESFEKLLKEENEKYIIIDSEKKR